MEKGQCVQDTLPTMYGIMIAFVTCLVGYALWVSVVYILSFHRDNDNAFFNSTHLINQLNIHT